jgi:hypothetical protein
VAIVHPDNPASRNPQFATAVFKSAAEPKSWLATARNLRASADAILAREGPVYDRRSGELHRISLLVADGHPAEELDEARFPFPNLDAALMLLAFSVENLLKGLLLAKGAVKFSGLGLPRELVSHNLADLHRRAAPKAAIKQHLLDNLTYFSVWRGRYPLPKDVEGFWPMRADGTMMRAVGFDWPKSFEEILAYCDQLQAELQETLGSLG